MPGFRKKSCVEINCHFPCHYHIPELLPSICTCLFFWSLPPEGRFNGSLASCCETKQRKKSYFWSFPDIISLLHWKQIHAFVLQHILIIISIQLRVIKYFSINQWFDYSFVNLKPKQGSFNLLFWPGFPHDTKTFVRYVFFVSAHFHAYLQTAFNLSTNSLLSCL